MPDSTLTVLIHRQRYDLAGMVSTATGAGSLYFREPVEILPGVARLESWHGSQYAHRLILVPGFIRGTSGEFRNYPSQQ